MKNSVQWKFASPSLSLYLVASAEGLQGAYWKKQNVPMLRSLNEASDTAAAKVLALTVSQLEEYLAGKRKDFELPLDAQGTEFQKSVWKQLSRIPYGKTYSYQQIAQRIRNPKACRAVGSANGKNPLSIIVPCHRVIAADGTLGGYAGGLKTKKMLLNLEQAF